MSLLEAITMHSHRFKIALLALVISGLACTLPGTASPTPFVFPTPNLTLTAIYEPTETPAGDSTTTPTATEVEPTAKISATPTATEVGATARPDANVRPNGPTISAIRLEAAPGIDGNLEDWPSQRWSATEVVYGASNWSGGSDLSASFVIGWDDDNLYIAANVNDDSHVQLATGYNLYRGDSVEILLDTLLETDFNSAVLSPDDYQIGLSPGNFSSIGPEAYRWFPSSVQSSLSSPIIESASTDDGYILEAQLPWIIFGVDPVAGEQYGFAFSVSDNDQAGTRTQQSMVSSVSTRVLTDPTSWGTLILETGPE